MFVDQVEIEIFAGNGGNGAVTFRTEKYVPHGGPNGGDGGRGGSAILEVDQNLSTLLDFRYKRHYKAPRGIDGMSKDMSGKNGENLVLRVPPGTMVYDRDTGELLADLTHHGDRAVVAKGGVGGRGNARFTTSVQQAPKFAEKGEPGEQRWLRLELKLLADVGLLGYPSVGKSTLIAAVSAARPKIADYPFTTLVPNLGVVYIADQKSFVMADLPGLIEGASEGIGLGHQFLRHVERTRVLIHMLDVSGLSERDPLEDYRILNRELALHNEEMTKLPQIVALNKIDVSADPEMIDRVEAALVAEGCQVFRISAAARMGLDPLLYAVWHGIEEERAKAIAAAPAEDEAFIVAVRKTDIRQWTAAKDEAGVWVIQGKALERMIAMTDLDNSFAVRRMQKSLERIGLNRRLKELGVVDGDTVRVGAAEFNYEDEEVTDEMREESRTT